MTDAQTDFVAERNELYAQAQARAQTDGEFRARLLTDPRVVLDALAVELGLEARVPQGVSIEVIDGSYDTLHLVLPAPLDRPLTETELERISGGTGRSAAVLFADAHGCPACPHPCVGPVLRKVERPESFDK